MISVPYPLEYVWVIKKLVYCSYFSLILFDIISGEKIREKSVVVFIHIIILTYVDTMNCLHLCAKRWEKKVMFCQSLIISLQTSIHTYLKVWPNLVSQRAQSIHHTVKPHLKIRIKRKLRECPTRKCVSRYEEVIKL